MLVSVIVVFKDEERFLREAVDSVLQQSSPDWELILVDDGSTDASSEIARQQVGRRPDHVRYLQHPGGANLGISASRNLGLTHARGEYIAYLDGDDVWLPTKLEEQAALMSVHPDVGLLYGPVQLWYSWAGEDASEQDGFIDLGVPTDLVIPPPRLLPQLIQNNYQTPTTSGSMLRRCVVEQVGGAEADFAGMYEDQALFTKVLAVTSTYVSGRCWTRYRQREDSVSATFRHEVPPHVGRLRYLTWAEAYLKTAGVRDRKVWRTLHREMLDARYPRVVRVRRKLARKVRSLRRGWAP